MNPDKRPVPDHHPPLFDSVKAKIKVLSSFWRTKQAIKAGEELYDYTSTELKQNGFMGPWKFRTRRSAWWMEQHYDDKNQTYRDSIGHSLNLGANELADVLHTFFLNVVDEGAD